MLSSDLADPLGGVDQATIGRQPGQGDQAHIAVDHPRERLWIDSAIGVARDHLQSRTGLYRFSHARQITGPFVTSDKDPLAGLPWPQRIERLTPCRRAAAGEGDVFRGSIEQCRGGAACSVLQLSISGLHRAAERFALQLLDDCIEGCLTRQGGTRMVEVNDPGAAGRGRSQIFDGLGIHGSSSKIASTSTATPLGRLHTPTAVRTCLPFSPSALTSRFEAPLATAPWR